MIWLVQLVFDCHDPDLITQFWGRLLDYDSELVAMSPEEVTRFRAEHPQFDGRGRIDDGDLRRMPVYLQRVAEPKVGRNRLVLEVTVPDGDALAIGDHADPEGNEYRVINAASATDRRLSAIVFDAVDPDALAAFWSAATGYVLDGTGRRCVPGPSALTWTGEAFTHPDLAGRELLHITGAGGSPGPARYDLTPALAFVPARAPNTGKNRIHVDLSSTDVMADRDRLVQLGATIERWDTDHVLLDPEGNEFCLGGRSREPA